MILKEFSVVFLEPLLWKMVAVGQRFGVPNRSKGMGMEMLDVLIILRSWDTFSEQKSVSNRCFTAIFNEF